MVTIARQSYVEELERQIAEELAGILVEVKRLIGVVEAQQREIDYLKRISRAPGARRFA